MEQPLWYECQVVLKRMALVDEVALAKAEALGFTPTYFTNFMGTNVTLHMTHPERKFLETRLSEVRECVTWESFQVKAVLTDSKWNQTSKEAGI